MSQSRHQQIAVAIKTALQAWADGLSLSDLLIQRTHGSSETIIREAEEAADNGFIHIVIPRVDADSSSRAGREDELQVFVCVVARLPDIAASTVDAWDLRTEQIRDQLNKLGLQRITLTDTTASRRGAAVLETTADADALHEHEVFFAVISMRYRFGVDDA